MGRVTMEEALEYCLANPDSFSVEELLMRFPEYGMELRPLLALSSQIRTVAPPPVPADRRAAMKVRVMNAAAAQGQATQAATQQVANRVVVEARRLNWIWAALRRPVFVMGSFAALLVALLWWGAALSLPSSPLYGVKLASENLLLSFAGDSGNRANAHLTLANTRLDDIETMSRQRNLGGIDGAVGNYDDHMNKSAILWKETAGQVQQAIKQSISAAVTRCEQEFKSFGGEVALLPAPVKAEVERLYSDLSTIRGEIGESPNMDGPDGITFITAQTATPGSGTPTVAVSGTGTAAPTRASTASAIRGTSTAPGTETEVVGGTETSVVSGTSIGTPPVGPSPTQQGVETQVATFEPTPRPSSGPSVISTAIIRITGTPRSSVTAGPIVTHAVSRTRIATSTSIPGSTGITTGTRTPAIPSNTSIVGTLPTSTNIATHNPDSLPSSTLVIIATSTVIPTIVVRSTIYIVKTTTLVVPTPVPPRATVPATILPTVRVEEADTVVPVPPTASREPTSEAECSLHVNNLQVQSTCAIDGDVGWTANVVNMSSVAQNGSWDVVLLVKAPTGGFVEVASTSGSGTFSPNSTTPMQGNFSHVIPENVKNLRVVVTLHTNGQSCEEAGTKDKACGN